MTPRTKRLARVLAITDDDVGGHLQALALECRRRDLAEMRVLSIAPNRRWGFPTDICDSPDYGAELDELLMHADVLHFVDVDPLDLGLAGILDNRKRAHLSVPRICLQFSGRLEASGCQRIVREMQPFAARTLCTRLGLSRSLGALHLPDFIPWWQPRYSPLLADTRSRESVMRPIVICVSSRVPIERRPRLENLVDQAEQRLRTQLVVETLVELPHRSVLRRRRFAHVFLSSSEDGLALSALEALAQGLRVLVPDEEIAAIRAEKGTIAEAPLFTASGLDALLAQLSPRSGPYAEARAFAKSYLDPARWLDVLPEFWLSDLARAA
jgi:hypothetical protein